VKTTLTGHYNSVISVVFSPDGQSLASGSWDGMINIWDVATGQVKTTLSGHEDYVHSVAFSSDGQTLASASEDDTIAIWQRIF
jgi:WD40 repeat protein